MLSAAISAPEISVVAAQPPIPPATSITAASPKTIWRRMDGRASIPPVSVVMIWPAPLLERFSARRAQHRAATPSPAPRPWDQTPAVVHHSAPAHDPRRKARWDDAPRRPRFRRGP